MSEHSLEPTPRTWPAESVPPPAELAVWLLACTDQERIDFVTRAQANAVEVRRNFEHDWEGQVAQYRHQLDALRGGILLEVAPDPIKPPAAFETLVPTSLRRIRVVIQMVVSREDVAALSAQVGRHIRFAENGR